MIRPPQSYLFATAALATVLTASGAWAQTFPAQTQPAESQSTAAQSDNTTTLDEVIVTAQKRSESAQSAAVAVTAVTGEELVRQGISNAQQLANVAPSVKLTALRQQTQVYLRGIGSSLTASNSDPAVAINVNGVYVPSEMSGGSFFDLERVEVLPGPQGTLYGRNAAGGAINVISKRPGAEFGGEAYFELGNYETANVFAAVDVPVNEQLRFRLAGLNQRHDFYVDGLNGNGTNEQDSTNVRLSALYTPTDRTTIYATATYGHEGGVPSANQNNPPTGDLRFIPIDSRALGLYTDFSTEIGTVQLDQQLTDNIDFTYIAGYAHIDGEQKLGLFQQGPATLLAPIETTAYSHEARLSGTYDRFNWIAGLYYFDSQADYLARAALPVPVIDNGFFRQNADGYAAFGQINYSLTARFRLTGGLRYSSDHKDLNGTNQTSTPAAVISRTVYSGDRDDTRTDYKVGFEFDAAPASLLYGSIQTGYNQGGFSNAVATPGSTAAVPYEPADVLAYTLGSKNRFFDRRLQLNLEAFYYDYSNYQVASRNLATGQNQIYNAEKAVTYGLQVDTRLLITSADLLEINLGFLHAEAETLVLSPVLNYNGFTLPFSPKITALASYQHTWDLASGARVEGRVSGRYLSDVWATYSHSAGTFQPSYGKVDLSLTWYAPDDRWSVALWGRNVTDKDTFALLNGGALPGPAAGFLDPPRTFGIRVGANF